MSTAQDNRPTVLVVDDKPNMLSLLAKVLRGDARVLTADGGHAALRILEEEPVQVVVCDLRMADVDGLAVLDATRRAQPTTQFVLMTAYATVPNAVEAMRRGAFDYITKPFEPDALREIVLRALGRAMVSEAAEGDAFEPLPGMIGRSPAMAELTRLVRRVARTHSTALVSGETGTGKELIARALHMLGERASERIVPLNCAAIPSELLESELFGHVRGAFTGADRDRAGLFEEASRGTLFLDELGELEISLQAKLTRALEERRVRRVGDSAERRIDVRLIGATHRDLGAMVRAGTFREDLFYRLRVATIHVPPLRERAGDVALLATHFLGELGSGQDGERIVGLSPQAMEALEQHAWPGNVRELRSAIERAGIVADGPRIELGDLPPEVRGQTDGAQGDELSSMTYQGAVDAARDEGTRRYLEAVLRRTGGKVVEAARIAGIERESFYRLLRRHALRPEDFRDRR